MSPKTKEQFSEIRKEKIELITETALKLFAVNGYNNTAVSRIAKEAGISKGLIYNYFDSKEELLKKIIFDGLESFGNLLEFEKDIKKEDIISFIDTNISLLKTNTEHYKLYFSLILQPDIFGLFEKEAGKFFENIFSVFTDYYSRKGCANPYVKARYILAAFDGIGIHYISDPENFPLDEVRNILIDYL